MMDKKHKLALISILLAAVFGGGIGVFGKIGLREIPPFTFTFLRFLIAIIFMMPFLLKEKPKLNKTIFKVIPFSLFAVANVLLFPFGIKLTTATIAQLLYVVVPVFVAILSYLILKELITFRKIIGVIFGFFGVAIIILLPIINKNSSIYGNLAGNLIILVAVISFSFYSVLSKEFQKDYSPVYLTTIFMIIAAIISFFFAIMEYKANPNWITNLSAPAILSVVYVGIFGSAVFYLLYQYAIKHGTPLIASMTLFLQPIATFIWAFILLNERLTVGIIFGAIFALTGALTVSLAKNQKIKSDTI